MEENNNTPVPEAVGARKPKKKKANKKLLWSLAFVLIAAMTIWAITSQPNFTLNGFLSFMEGLDGGWLALAFLAMAGFIIFEALAILTLCRAFGYKKNAFQGLSYSTSDIYFSAITPSATGGQPASAFFMIKDGIPGSVVTVVLLANLVLYTFSILAIGTSAICLNPALFLDFSPVSIILIIAGGIMQVAIAIAFIFLLFKSKLLHKICDWFLRLLAKLRIIRKLERKREKLKNAIESYKGYVSELSGKVRMILLAFLFNLLQRASLIAVTIFVFLAAGGPAERIADVWVSESFVVIGSNSMPIPGGMGVADYLLIDAFELLGLGEVAATNLGIVSRAVSFYSCVIICGLTLVARIIIDKIISRVKEKRESKEQGEKQ